MLNGRFGKARAPGLDFGRPQCQLVIESVVAPETARLDCIAAGAKLSGEAALIDDLGERLRVADFDKIADGVQLPPNAKVPEFPLPEGWKRGGPRGSIVAETVKSPDGTLEITISCSC